MQERKNDRKNRRKIEKKKIGRERETVGKRDNIDEARKRSRMKRR